MGEALKKRLLGALILIALAIIFIPALIGTNPVENPKIDKIPRAPEPLPQQAAQALKETAIAPDMPESVKVAPTPTVKNTKTEKQVVEQNTPLPNGLQAWVVQVGSFSQRENAQRLVTKLRKAKFQTPAPERVVLEGKTVYRVKVGPILQKAKAEKMLSKINQISGAQGRVVRYP